MRITVRSSRWAASLALVLLISCGGDEPTGDVYTGPGATVAGSEEALSDRVAAIIEASNAATQESPYRSTDLFGRTVELPGRAPVADPPVELPPTTPPNLYPGAPESLGTVALSLELLPAAMAVGNNGEIVYTENRRTMLWRIGGETMPLADRAADQLQFDATGDRLLLQVEDEVMVLSGSDWSDRKTYRQHPPGTAWWAPERGQLFFTRELLDFDASARSRVQMEIAYFDLESEQTIRADWSVMGRYARVGTLPPIAITWGVLTRPYMLDPVPGALYRIEEGTPVEPLTTTAEEADIQPSADRQGRLFFIRTPRHRSGGGRAMYRQFDWPEGRAEQITLGPTHLISAAPMGPWLGVVQGTKAEGYQLRLIDKEKLSSEGDRFRVYTELSNALTESAREVEAALIRQLASRPEGSHVKESEFGPIFDAVPTPELVQDMANALRVAMRLRFGIEEQEPLALLRQVDYLFDLTHASISEHPAMIMALAGLFAEAIPDAKWSLEGASTELSVEVRDIHRDADPAGTLVLPFGAARERIALQISLSEIAAQLNAEDRKPVYLVENFGGETNHRVASAEWRDAGLPRSMESLSEIDSAIDREDVSPQVLQRIHQLARQHKEPELAIKAALELAERYPDRPAVLRALAATFMEAYHTREALAVFEQAALLDPADAGTRFRIGDALIALDRLEEAREAFETAALLPGGDSYADEIVGRLALISELEAK